jgi:hypothetical protein
VVEEPRDIDFSANRQHVSLTALHVEVA